MCAASSARLVAVADVLVPDDGLPLRYAGLVCLVAALSSHHHPPGCHGHLPLPDLVWAQLPVLLRYAGQVEVCCCCCYGTRSVLFLGHLLLVDVGKECGCWSLFWNLPLFFLLFLSSTFIFVSGFLGFFFFSISLNLLFLFFLFVFAFFAFLFLILFLLTHSYCLCGVVMGDKPTVNPGCWQKLSFPPWYYWHRRWLLLWK